MKPNMTDINIVLDRSGSMDAVKNDTIGGYNAFLAEQKAAPGEAAITLVQFDHEYEVVYQAAPLSDAKQLDGNTFVPRGNTALYDAVGRTINATGARLSAISETERPGKVIFVILTDGEENASKEFSATRIAEMIQHQKDHYQWEFVFLGANQDAITAAAKIGIQQANAMTYAANARGTADAFGTVAKNMVSYRMGVSKSAAFDDDDRELQRKAGAYRGTDK